MSLIAIVVASCGCEFETMSLGGIEPLASWGGRGGRNLGAPGKSISFLTHFINHPEDDYIVFGHKKTIIIFL
jgi:hypothetical protein